MYHFSIFEAIFECDLGHPCRFCLSLGGSYKLVGKIQPPSFTVLQLKCTAHVGRFDSLLEFY